MTRESVFTYGSPQLKFGAGAADEIGFVKTLAEGIAITQKSLAACFERHKIAKVTPEIGEKFDHNRHQAM